MVSSSSPTLALAQDPVALVPTALAHDDDAQVVARWANPKKPVGSLSTPSRQYHASLAVLISRVHCSRIVFGSARQRLCPFPINLATFAQPFSKGFRKASARLPPSRFSSRVPLASVPEKPRSLTPIPSHPASRILADTSKANTRRENKRKETATPVHLTPR